METPLTTRRITRSLAAAAVAAQKSAAAGSDFSWPKNADAHPRAALHDITNDSPIVGLAAPGLHNTPASTARRRRTPGSGEALLRGQVKALLHKVHEEQAPAVAPPLRPARLQALLATSRSPAQLLAPTPANTPQLGLGSVSAAREGPLPPHLLPVPCVLEDDELLLPKPQVVAASLPPPQPEEEEKLGECQLNRALVFDDSPGKSDGSAVSFQESSTNTKGSCMDKSSSPEDDSSSAWSIQVHASSEEEELGAEGTAEELGVGEEEYYTEEEEEYYTEAEEEQQWDDDDSFDDLCEVMSMMTVFDEEDKPGLPQFEGKHTRFIYNSDDEMEREEVVDAAEARGLPVPEGRHLRFQEDDDEDEE